MPDRQAIASPAELGTVIRERRLALGLTQSEVAAAADTSLRFVSELERGKATARLAGVMRVLGVLGLEVEVRAR